MAAETHSLIYTLTVPCSPESLAVLEGLAETFLTASSHLPADIALVLRLSVAEACRNALAQVAPPGRLNLVTMTFWRIGPSELFDFALEIEDPGLGLAVEGSPPPYPPSLVGEASVVATLMGQMVLAHVEDPHNLVLSVVDYIDEQREPNRDVIQGMHDMGLALLALARCWQTVRISYDVTKGSRLRLEKPRLVV